MTYLHEDTELFKEMIDQTVKLTKRKASIIEKDYYQMLILQELSKQLDGIVFKGGTSLSKGFKVINRFSEDIDITFTEHLGHNRRKKLKNEIIKGISENLNIPISNWNQIQSDRDVNAYHFQYDPIYKENDKLLGYVKLETALGSYAFPTEKLQIKSYISDVLDKNQKYSKILKDFDLPNFQIKVQSLERTYIDKVFAICDYYIKRQSNRLSRHIYDIYLLTPHIKMDENFCQLISEVRLHRQQTNEKRKKKGQQLLCPSAESEINISEILMNIYTSKFFKDDYEEITNYMAMDEVKYEKAIEIIKDISEKSYFITY